MLAGLMVSRVPYPSFKGIDLQKHGRVEVLLGALVVIAAMLFAMPQFTTFALATAYVLSGPILLARGERIARVVPPSRPALNEASKSVTTSPPAEPHAQE